MVCFGYFLKYQKSDMYVVQEIFLHTHTYFYNNDLIIMTSLVLKARSHCEKFTCRRTTGPVRPRIYE